MPEPSFTDAQLTALEAAIAEGVLSVEYNGRRVVYRTMDEMLQARNLLRQKLGYTKREGGGLFGGTRITAKHSKGLW